MASRNEDAEPQYSALEALALIQADEAAEVDVFDSSSDDEGLLSFLKCAGDTDEDTDPEYLAPVENEEEYEPPCKIRPQMGTWETSSNGGPRETSQATPDMPEISMQDSAAPFGPWKAAAESQQTTAPVEDRNEDDATQDLHRFRPTRDPGPVLDTSVPWSVVELFQLFFSITTVNTIITNTNLNAEKQIREGKKYKWTPLTLTEFYNFLSIVIYTGLCSLHKLSDYWRKGMPYNHPFPGSVMTRDRFEAILWSLHLSNPADDEENDRKKDTPDYDVLCKIKPLYTDIQTACRSFFHPDKDISIDERIVPAKERQDIKQRHKAKPTKQGYKLYALADSASAYTWNFFIYEGKNPLRTDQGPSNTSVLDSMPFHLLGNGYTLHVDKFYRGPRHFGDAQKNNSGSCGKKPVGFTETVENNVPERGEVRWIRDDKLMFIKWMDKIKVTVRRKVKRQGVQQMLNMGVECNKNMEGEDVSNAPIGFHNVQHKTMKWYKTFFYYFLDMAVVNCHILHQELCKRNPDLQPLTQKNFREKLVTELVEFGKGPCVPQTFFASVAPKGLTCMPEYMGGDASQCRKYCRLCFNAGDKKVKTPIQCRKCLVALCLTSSRNCFRDWHDETAV